MPFWTRGRLACFVLALLYMGAVSAAIARERMPKGCTGNSMMYTGSNIKLRFRQPEPHHR
jgi:hypothetical protein